MMNLPGDVCTPTHLVAALAVYTELARLYCHRKHYEEAESTGEAGGSSIRVDLREQHGGRLHLGKVASMWRVVAAHSAYHHPRSPRSPYK